MIVDDGTLVKRKAVVAVAGPFRLYQAIYFTYLYPDYEWDIIIMAYGSKEEAKENIREFSEKSERFKNIYISKTLTQFSDFKTLLIECFKMTFSYIFGKKEQYSKKMILDTVDEFNYDLICVACSYSLMEGALLNFAKYTTTILMEEGMDDYIEHEVNLNFLKKVAAKLLFKMGYINLLCDNSYEPLKECEKFVRYPQIIRRNNYKKVNKMFDFSLVDEGVFNKTVEKVFEIEEENYDVVIYTTPPWMYNLEKEYFKFERYISDMYNGKKILVKRHPQDTYLYKFEGVDAVEKYKEIPGEIIFEHWKKSKHIFLFPSTVLLGMIENIDACELFKFSNAENEIYNECFENAINLLKLDKNNIIQI